MLGPGHGKTRGLPGFVLLALAMALAGCPAADNQPAGDLAGRTVRVATTTGMIADIARNVGGERVARCPPSSGPPPRVW